MIAQVLAAEYPERIDSLTILFSSTNQPLLPPPAPSLLLKLLRCPSPQASKVELMDQQKSLLRAIGSQTYPMEESELDALVERLYERGADTDGTRRQMAALLGTGDLRRYCRRIAAGTLVIHGLDDRLIPPTCGKAVARMIPNAALELIPDMAHDLPRRLWPRLINLLTWQASGRFRPSEHSQ